MGRLLLFLPRRAEHFDLTMLADAVAVDDDQSDTGLSPGTAS